MKLKHVGFFSELEHGDTTGPSLKRSVRPAAGYERDAVAGYLRAAALLIGSPGLVRDVLDPTASVIGAPNIFTDGEWAWPEDLAFYVKKYNVELPEEFIQALAARAYKPPVDGVLDLSQLEL